MRKAALSWNASSVILSIVLQVIQLAIVARIFTLEQLGVVAIANVIITLITMFSDFGATSYFISKQTLSYHQSSSLYWLTVLIGAFFSFFTFVIAPYIALFYEMENLTTLLWIASLNLLIISFSSQIYAGLTKSFNFLFIAKLDIVIKLIAFISTLLFLYFNIGLLSPILGFTVSIIVRVIILAFCFPKQFLPKLTFDLQTNLPALSFGFYQISSQSLNQIRANLDLLLIAKLVSSEAAGVYSLAKELVSKPSRLIQPLISRFSLYWLTVLIGAFFSFFTFVIAPYIALFYEMENLTTLLKHLHLPLEH